MNYNELVAEIQHYTENVFSKADIDTFITQTEQRVLNAVQLPASRKLATLATVFEVPTVALPADYLSTFSVSIGLPLNAQTYLLNKDPNFLREAFPTAATGQPTHYALTGAYEITLAPIPNAVYPVYLAYFAYPASITTAGTSWLGDNFSSVLLYGSLVEAYIFMKGEQDMLTMYDGKFKEAMALLKQLVDAKNRQDTFRDGQVRYPVK